MTASLATSLRNLCGLMVGEKWKRHPMSRESRRRGNKSVGHRVWTRTLTCAVRSCSTATTAKPSRNRSSKFSHRHVGVWKCMTVSTLRSWYDYCTSSGWRILTSVAAFRGSQNSASTRSGCSCSMWAPSASNNAQRPVAQSLCFA